jgi:hypothetical protein
MLLVSKVFFAALVLGVVLGMAACSSVNPSQDIPPLTPETNLGQETSPVGQPAPTSTGLPTEIVEPLSPVSPTIPEAAPAMDPAKQAVPPIPGSEAALAAAIADLAKQTSLPADQITLVSIEVTDWSDTSLGCPQEGMMYAQVITPGYLIVLEAQGQQYEYHTDQAANVVWCNQ